MTLIQLEHVFLDICSNWIIMTGLFLLLRCVYPVKQTHFVARTVTMAGACALQALLCVVYHILLNTVTSILLMVLLTKLFFKTHKWYFLIYCAIVLSALALAEMLCDFFLAFLHSKNVMEIMTDAQLIRYLLYLTLVVLLFYLLSFFLKRRIESFEIHLIACYIGLNAGEFLLIACIAEDVFRQSNGFFLLIVSAMFFLFDIYFLYTFQRFSRTKQAEKTSALILQQSQMQKKAYADLLDQYQASVRIVHDVKHHLYAFEALMRQGDYDKAETYKKTMTEVLDQFVPTFRSKNQMLAVILNQTIAEAKRGHIRLELNIADIDMRPLSDYDLTTILSNLLENALEACVQLQDTEAYIHLDIDRRLGFLVLHVENPCEQFTLSRAEMFESTKPDHMGVGLLNVRKTVEQYHGVMKIAIEHQRFNVQISIPLYTGSN